MTQDSAFKTSSTSSFNQLGLSREDVIFGIIIAIAAIIFFFVW